jgi:hypothetical protein
MILKTSLNLIATRRHLWNFAYWVQFVYFSQQFFFLALLLMLSQRVILAFSREWRSRRDELTRGLAAAS